MVKIVLDAFGGDYAPVETVAGAVQAINNNADIHVVLTGKEDIIKQELQKYSYNENQISIINANEVIDNNESATVAIRTKKDSSLVRAFDFAKDNDDAIGVISAGSTGAVLTGGFMKFGRIKGIHRPALCPVFGTLTGSLVSICDCGANMDCKPEYLEQFGLMASAYHKILGNESPRVALLNVGTEDHKGDARSKETFELLKKNDKINFVGNMEARDLLSGEYDVVVTDGFAGNIALKTIEGAAKVFTGEIKGIFYKSLLTKLCALGVKKYLGEFKKKFDYKEYGGAPLLGIKRPVVKAHGSSDEKSFFAALKQAQKWVSENVTEDIADYVKKQEK